MRGQRGFTLIEVLAALLILALIFTTSLAVFYDRQRRLRDADELVSAYQALANEAEASRRISFDAFAPGSSRPFVSDTTILDSLHDAQTDVAVVDWKPGIRLVEMSVQWRHRTKSAKMTVVRVSTGGGNFW